MATSTIPSASNASSSNLHYFFFTKAQIVININIVFWYVSNYICFWEILKLSFAIFSVYQLFFQTQFLRPFHLAVFQHKWHYFSLISTQPSLIRGVPRWMARKAGPVGQSSRAGGARAAGTAVDSSRAAGLVAREAGTAGQKLQLMSLVLTSFPNC